MQTEVEEVGENRVRLRVEVPSSAVRHAVEHAASDLSASMKIPGFRKGKVPMPVLVARVGRQQLMAEAVDSHIGGWFLDAAARARIRPVTQPEYDFDLPASDKGDWTFTATVDVQAKPDVADWTALEVPRQATEVPAELVDAELDRLRHTVAELSPVEERPVRPDDVVVLDLVGPSGDAQRDVVVELGAGQLAAEIEQGIVGMASGETKRVEFELSDDQTGSVEVTLREVHEKVLPPPDDELARAASEFDTIEELRADIESVLREQLEHEVESAFRAAAVDALVDASNVDAAGPLVERRTRELLTALVRSVESRGIPFGSYLQLTGTSESELVSRMREEAHRSVARELVLEAVADRLELHVSEEDVERVIREQAEAEGEDPEPTIERLRHTGGYEQLRADLRLRAALDRVAADVKPISTELAAARDRLWTPDKEKPATETKLWTPGSKEPA